MNVQVFLLILIVLVDLIVTAVLLFEILSRVKSIDFKANRIDVNYRYLKMIEDSCDDIRVLLRAKENFNKEESGASVGEFENDIKNIMNYSPSPKKRKEIKRKAGENN